MKRKLVSWLQMLFNAVYSGSLLERDLKKASNISEEGVWHHVFNQSFRAKEPNRNLPINMGRWAGGASFLYILHRILEATRPVYILEMGLGESSKFISHFLSVNQYPCKHIVVEHDEEWVRFYSEQVALSERTEVEVVPVVHRKNRADGIEGLVYQSIREEHWTQADLIVIDGPFGRGKHARSNVLDFVDYLSPKRPFVLVFDDAQRPGEQNTIKELLQRLDAAGIEVHIGKFGGIKQCIVISSSEFAWIKTA